MKYVTVSAKIPKEMKEKLEKLGIKPGPVIRRALEAEIKRTMLKKLEERAKKLAPELSSIPDEEVARIIREDRER